MSITTQFLFTSGTSYSYDTTKIDFSGGVAKLKNIQTPTNYTQAFSSGTPFTYDSTKILFSAGVAKLNFVSASTTLNQPFTSSTGFTFDSTKSEFVAGKLQQKDTRPTNATFAATYTSTIDASWGNGTLTGTGTGSPVITGNKLDLTGGTVKYVDYAGTGNANALIQTGTIRFKITPNYTGAPSVVKVFFDLAQAAGNANNDVYIQHNPGAGSLSVGVSSSTATTIVSAVFGNWTPTSGVSYEFELDFDVTVGATRLFIDGVQFGTTKTNTGTRSSSTGLIRVGNYNTGTAGYPADFYIDDFVLFSTVQHTANYTPGAVINDTIYVTTDAICPEMQKVGDGTFLGSTAFSTTESNTPKYTVQIAQSGNYLYWNGSAWVTSNNTYAQANDVSTFNTNVAALSTSGAIYVQFRIFFTASNNQAYIDDLTLTLNQQVYSTTNPTVDLTTAIIASVSGQAITAYTSFNATITAAGSDAVAFNLSTDNGSTWKYWDGAAWSASSGYSQSNSGAVVNTNIGALTPTVAGLKYRVFLHSNNGQTSPNIDNLIIGYNDYIYATTNPTIKPTAAIPMQGIFSYINSISATGSDTIKYTIEVQGIEKYWNGSLWVTSSGYTQSNTAAEINSNVSSLNLVSGYNIKPVIYFHSNDGTTTPTITSLTIEYDFWAGSVTAPNECIVWGYIYNADGDPIQNVKVNAVLTNVSIYASSIQVAQDPNKTTTNSFGYWELSLIETVNMTPTTTKYTFDFTSTNYNDSEDRPVPNQVNVNYATLT